MRCISLILTFAQVQGALRVKIAGFCLVFRLFEIDRDRAVFTYGPEKLFRWAENFILTGYFVLRGHCAV